MGYLITAVSRGRRLAHRPLRNRNDLVQVEGELREMATNHGADTVFGVFPAPLLESLRGLNLVASWTVDTEHGYAHRRWCEVRSKPPAPPVVAL